MKIYIYMVWGLKHGNKTAFPLGCYRKYGDAQIRLNELCSSDKKNEWKWIDIKTMELY